MKEPSQLTMFGTSPSARRAGICGRPRVALVKCARCGAPVTKPQWYVNQSQSGRFYCRPCFKAFGTQGVVGGRGRTRNARIAVPCSLCGKELHRYRKQVAKNKSGFFCKGACSREARVLGLRARAALKARELDRYHNGHRVRLDRSGYLLVYEPANTLTNRYRTQDATGRCQRAAPVWCFEHRLVAERTYGPLRKGEHVHHVNGIKTDNRPENLQVLSRQEHRKLHSDQITEKLRRLDQYERLYGPMREGPVTETNLRTLRTKGVQ